jgi:hypothetical protein
MNTDTAEHIVDLVEIPEADAKNVFETPRSKDGNHPIDPILASVRAVIDQFAADVSTPGGRKQIASMAHRISKAKAAIERAGKQVADEAKKVPKIIDANRKHAKDLLDEWHDEVRKPLNKWEASEEQRVKAITDRVAEIEAAGENIRDLPSSEISERIKIINDTTINEKLFEEYAGAATEIRSTVLAMLEEQLPVATKREDDAAELERLRAAEAERVANAEAAKAAALKSHQQTDTEPKTVEDDANARVAKGVEQAKKEQAAAVPDPEIERRSAINRTALQAFVDGGLDSAAARQAVILIAQGRIPAVSISY